MKFIVGKKLDMTQVFREDGVVVPVTRVQAGPCTITQVKDGKENGVKAVQVGFGDQKTFRLNKAKQGHLKGLASLRVLRDFRVDDDLELKRGDSFGVKIFEAGEKVQVTGKAKGKGFQGVVKRHGFKGASASHGTKDQERMPGSIGATGPARVFKGVKMGGHMGDHRVTVKNLEIVEVKPEENELWIKGAVPGARGGFLLISTQDGKIEIEADEVPAETTDEADKTEEPEAASADADAMTDKEESADEKNEKSESKEIEAEASADADAMTDKEDEEKKDA